MFLVDTTSKKEKHEYDDWGYGFTIPKDSEEITTKPIEKVEGCECGSQPPVYDISGGSEANPHEFPWMVRIVGGCALGEQSSVTSIISKQNAIFTIHVFHVKMVLPLIICCVFPKICCQVFCRI